MKIQRNIFKKQNNQDTSDNQAKRRTQVAALTEKYKRYFNTRLSTTDFADNITKICSTNTMKSATAGRYHKRVFTPSPLGKHTFVNRIICCRLSLFYTRFTGGGSAQPSFSLT